MGNLSVEVHVEGESAIMKVLDSNERHIEGMIYGFICSLDLQIDNGQVSLEKDVRPLYIAWFKAFWRVVLLICHHE